MLFLFSRPALQTQEQRHITLVAIAPTIQAVVPPPDGGYPGGNTAEGKCPFEPNEQWLQYGGRLGVAAQRYHWKFQYRGWPGRALPYKRRREYSRRYGSAFK